MLKKLGYGIALTVLVLGAAACGQLVPQPTLAADKAARLAGGGAGVVTTNGTLAEGVLVLGTGVVNAEPDMATIVFGVDLRGNDPAEIVNEGATKVARAIDALVKMGISEDDIRTANYNLWVETIYEPETGRPTGEIVYHLTHQARVTLHDLDKVGSALAGVVEAGANNISEVSFSVEDSKAMADEAMKLALTDARTRAEQMAEGLGVTLGKPASISQTSGNYPLAREYGIGGGGADMAASVPVISPGTFSLTVSVQVVYSIQ